MLALRDWSCRDVCEELQRKATEAGGLSTHRVINILIHPHVAHSNTVSLWETEISKKLSADCYSK